MSARNRVHAVIAVIAVLAGSAGSASAALVPLAVTYASETNTLIPLAGARYAGFKFTTNAAGATVSSLNYALNGAQTSSVVNLYHLSGSTVVIDATATVTTADPTATTGSPTVTYYVHDIPDITLSPNSVYYVAGAADVNTIIYSLIVNKGVDPAITFGGLASDGVYGSAANPTTNALNLTNSYFSVNIGLEKNIPEPATLALGLGGALALIRRQWRLA